MGSSCCTSKQKRSDSQQNPNQNPAPTVSVRSNNFFKEMRGELTNPLYGGGDKHGEKSRVQQSAENPQAHYQEKQLPPEQYDPQQQQQIVGRDKSDSKFNHQDYRAKNPNSLVSSQQLQQQQQQQQQQNMQQSSHLRNGRNRNESELQKSQSISQQQQQSQLKQSPKHPEHGNSQMDVIESERRGQYETNPSQVKYPSTRRPSQLNNRNDNREESVKPSEGSQKQTQGATATTIPTNSDGTSSYKMRVNKSSNQTTDIGSLDSTKISLNASSILQNGENGSENSEEFQQINKQIQRLKELPTRQRYEEEEKIVTSFIQRNDIQCCVLSQRWAKAYSDCLTKRELFNTPIENGNIVDVKLNKLKDKLTEKEDYILISEKVWHIIFSLYGGGPLFKIKRNISSYLFRATGLENNSNYCYMNACIQSICSISELNQYFIEKHHEKMLGIKKKQELRFSLAFAELLARFRTRSERPQVISPDKFKSLSAKRFEPQEQHDAQEYLRYMLGEIQDELNQKSNAKKPTEFKDSEQALAYYFTIHTSIIDTLFYGQLISRVQCKKCNYVSNTYDPFLDLSLPIDSRNIRTINNALDQFIKPEEIDGDYKCDKCHKTSHAIQSTILSKAPKYLVLHLKRFKMFPYRQKIKSDITYEATFDIAKYLEDPKKEKSTTYQLISVIVHSGSPEYGHYVSFTKRNEQWWYCDDENIQQCDLKDVLNREAYLLFYQKD